MIYLYKILVYCLVVMALPVLVLLWIISEKRRKNLLQRLGICTGIPESGSGEKSIWIHALSVGEVTSAIPLVKELNLQYPAQRIVFTAATFTGFETANRLMGKEAGTLVSAIGYFPFDMGWSIRRVAKKINPICVILIETDLWPGFLHEMQCRNIPVLLANARLSLKSMKGYLRFGFFFLPLFSYFKRIFVQSGQDAERFVQLGLGRDLLRIAGNLKYDQMIPLPDLQQAEELKKSLGIRKNQRILIGGSTHAGEEEVLLQVFSSLRKKDPALVLILVPRNPARCVQLISCVQKYDVSAALLSDGALKTNHLASVVFIDRIGLLTKLYTIADAAFVGGSLVPEGGHNPLEAAAASCPSCFGPDMSDFTEIAGRLTAGGGAVQIGDAMELEQLLSGWFENDQERVETGRRARAVFLSQSGAAKKIVRSIEEIRLV